MNKKKLLKNHGNFLSIVFLLIIFSLFIYFRDYVIDLFSLLCHRTLKKGF